MIDANFRRFRSLRCWGKDGNGDYEKTGKQRNVGKLAKDIGKEN